MPTFPPRAHGSGYLYLLGPRTDEDKLSFPSTFAHANAPKYPMQSVLVPKANKRTDQLQNTNTNTKATANCKTPNSPVALLSNPLRTSPNRRVAASGGEGTVAAVGCCSPGSAGPMAGAGGPGGPPAGGGPGGSAILGASLGLLKMRRGLRENRAKIGSGLSPSNISPYTDMPHVDSVPESCVFCFLEQRGLKGRSPVSRICQRAAKSKREDTPIPSQALSDLRIATISMSDQNKDEISITLTDPSGAAAESIVVSASATTLEELASLSVALGVAPENSSGSNGKITLAVDGRVVYDGSGGQRTLGDAGVGAGDMVLVGSGRGTASASASAPSAPAPAAAPAAPAGGGGGLDFSALLASAGASAPTSSAAPDPVPAAGGGLSFNIAGLEMAASAAQRTVEWPGMSLDDAIAQNPNPARIVPLLLR